MKKVIIISLIVITISFVTTVLITERKNPYDIAINDNVIQTQSFSVNTDSTDLETSANGTIFIKGKGGEAEHIQIVASIDIDPNDWGGVTFYAPDNWRFTNIQSSYPEDEPPSEPKEYVSQWLSQSTEDEWSAMVEVGRSREYIPTGGGKGMLIIDLVPEKPPIKSNTFYILVAVGSDKRNGVKIIGTDFIKIPISLSNTEN